jgi:hypothetical protein
MNRVGKEESIRPKITAEPREVQVSLLRVMGRMPKMVQMEVIKMASRRDLPAVFCWRGKCYNK